MKRYYLFLFIGALLLCFSSEGAWAKGEVTFYAKLKTQVASSCSNMGKVYAGTSNSAGTYNAPSSTSGELNSGEQASGTTEYTIGTFYAFAQENPGYKFKGWKESDDANAAIVSSANPYSLSIKSTSQTSGSGTQKVLYAFFEKTVSVNITFIGDTKGSYQYTISGSTTTVDGSNQNASNVAQVSLSSPSPKSGYAFAGFYQINTDGTTTDLSGNNPSVTFTESGSISIGARFVSTSLPKFIIKETSTQYYGLKAACAAATPGQTIVPVSDATLTGEDLLAEDNGVYIIPSGVTLLIPYDAANTVEKDQPTSVDPAAASNCKPYRTLTLADGITLSVSGAISVATKQYATNTTYTQTGVRTYYGFIYLNANSKIVLNSGATLYAWGYISGDGEVIANSGSTVYEMFQFQDFRGGSRTKDMAGNSQKVFPFQQYYIQNIESKLTLEYGATEYVRLIIYMGSTQFPNTIKLVGTEGAMFTMSGGSGRVTKQYERATDRMHYTFSGTASLSSISLTFTYIFSITVNSKDYVLPINNNMTIDILSGTTFNMTQDISVLPGAEINIESGAKVVVPSGKALYVYDQAEWIGKGCCFSSTDLKQLAHVGRNNNNTYGAPKARSITSSAKIKVDGTLEVSGTLYTTTTGADICSSGSGVISMKAAAGTATKTYQDKGNSDYQEIGITAAKLHNADGSYTATAGAAANTTINYKNGHWGWMEIWKDADGETVLGAANTTAKVNNAAAKDNLLPTPPTGYEASWETTVDDANQEVIHTVVMTKNSFTVTWKDESKVLKEETLAKNTKPSYDYQKPASEQWVYTMTGWSDGTTTYAADELPLVTKDVTYIAQYDADPRTYTIRFLNDDNSVLQSSALAYGATPQYNGATPQSTIEDGLIRAFTGWSTEIEEHSVVADADYTAQYDVVASLLVNSDQTIAVNGSVTTTTVQVHGSLTIQEGKTLHTSVLILESNTEEAGEVIGNLEAETAYYDYHLGGSGDGIWYDIAVPWEVDATTGIYIDSVQKQLNKDFYLIYYNGALRAQQNKHTDACWQFVNKESTPDKYMHPGKLYMIYLPNAGVNTLRFERHGSGLLTVPAIEVSRYDAGNVMNAGWNGIANPAPYKAYLNAGANTVQPNNYASQVPNFGQKYIPASDNYEVFNMSTTPLETAQPVFVQVAENKTVVLDRTHYPSMAIPARRAIVENAYYEVQIAGESNAYNDRLYLMTMADKEDQYVIGLDLAKAGVSTKVAQMWVDRYNTKLCVNTTAPAGTSAMYPLGIYAPQDGDYQISSVTDMQPGQEMYVTLNGRTIWNLAYGPYTASLTAGTHNEYGLKLIQTPATPTGVENVQGDNVQGTKVVIDDHVYIIRGGEVYTITGQKIQ